jgi:hypothetical protein
MAYALSDMEISKSSLKIIPLKMKSTLSMPAVNRGDSDTTTAVIVYMDGP